MNHYNSNPSMKYGERLIIQRALQILERYHQSSDIVLSNSESVINFLRLKFELAEREIFSAFFLNSQLRLIAFQEFFYGTVNQTAIFPREIAKAALRFNAVGVILAHNHPSGWAEPSAADRKSTVELQQALKLIDVKVIDHIIIGAGRYVSFAKRGLLKN